MARARLYIRRSADDQSGYSPAAQERESRNWCAEKGHEVVGEPYIDDDLSGGKEDRVNFQRLLTDAKADPGSLIVVHKYDRLARDTEVLLRVVYKELLPKRVRVASVIERYDPYTPEGKAMLSVQATFSTLYIDNLAGEVSKGYREKFERGGWIGPLPLGYESRFDLDARGERIKGTGRAVFSADADVARLIFERYATGNYSDLSLAQELNERGLTTICKGRRVPFQKDTIGGILTNRFYLGVVTYNGEERQGAHEPLIDQALWDRVQAIRAARARAPGGGPLTHRPERGLLLELAYCGRCGARLHWNRGDKADGRYWCSRRRQYGKAACDAPLIVAPTIEAQLLDTMRTLSIPPSYRNAVIQVVRDRLTRPATADEAAVRAMHAQFDRIKDLYELGDMAKAEYLRKREQIRRQIERSTPTPLRTLDIERAMELLSSLPALLTMAAPAQQRALLRQIIARVWIEKYAVTGIQPTATYAVLMGTLAQVSKATSAGLHTASDTSLSFPPLWSAFQTPLGTIGGAA